MFNTQNNPSVMNWDNLQMAAGRDFQRSCCCSDDCGVNPLKVQSDWSVTGAGSDREHTVRS